MQLPGTQIGKGNVYGGLSVECPEKRPGSGVRILMQNYKSIQATVMTCATLVNTQTHRETDKHRETDIQILAGCAVSSARLKEIN